MAEGWICIARKITEWEWYSDSNVFRLFMHLLLNANFRDHKWQGILVSRGQLVTSRGKISEQIGLTVKQIRLAENKLTSCGAVDAKGANKFTLYTIVKYDDYQTIPTREAMKGQTKGKQKSLKGQHLNNDNNGNNDNNVAIPIPEPLPDWLPLDAWVAFLEMRKGKKSVPTDYAKQLLLSQLDKLRAKGHDPTAVIEQSIRKGWKDFFEIKENHYEQTERNATQPTKADRAKAAVLRAAVSGGFAPEGGFGQQADFGYPAVP